MAGDREWRHAGGGHWMLTIWRPGERERENASVAAQQNAIRGLGCAGQLVGTWGLGCAGQLVGTWGLGCAGQLVGTCPYCGRAAPFGLLPLQHQACQAGYLLGGIGGLLGL